MKLTPTLEVKGLKAFEQVRAFEALQRRRLPWIYVGFTLSLVIMGGVMLRLQQRHLAWGILFCTIFFAFGSALSWRREKARYAENLKVLAEMESLYGDQLPWVQVEKHFAALEKLQEELVKEKVGAALREVVDEKKQEAE